MMLPDLPPDVLTVIFEWSTFLANGIPSIREAPLNLSHTCRSFRQLLLSSGHFWAHLRCLSPKVHGRLAQMWLERSLDARITFRAHGLSGIDEEEDLEAWRQVFSSKLSQFRALSVSFEGGLENIKPSTLHDLSTLTELVLRKDIPFGLGERGRFTPLFIVPSVEATMRPIAPLLPSLYLRKVNGGNDAQRGLLAMLRHCPN